MRRPIYTDNYIAVKICGKMVNALIDTGSVTSIINDNLAHRLRLRLKPLQRGDSKVLFSASGTSMPVVATAEIPMCFSGLWVTHSVKVVRNISHELILGADFLKQNIVTINYRLGVITIGDNLVTVPLQSYRTQQCCVATTEAICIPGHSEAIVSVRCPIRFNGKIVMIEPISSFQFRMFAVARSFSKCKDGKTVCKILNYNPNTLVLRKNLRVGRIEQVNNVVSCVKYDETAPADTLEPPQKTNKQTPQTLDKFLTDYGFAINPQLTTEQRYELLQLLYEYKEVFARSLHEIKQYPHYELDIDLLSKRRAFRRQFRLHTDDADAAQKQIDEMLQTGVIEDAESAEFNSPIFLVGKKDGSKRLVVDLRGVNQLIAPKLVQLPKVTHLIDDLASLKPKFLNICDLRSGYWQVRIKKESRPLTSFTAPSGRRYQFCVCPFGLNISPAAMLYILTSIFAGKGKKSGIFLYMDDLLSVGSTWGENLKNLEVMLQTLCQNQLTCNPTKCQFGFNEIEYLGFRVSADGIKISERKIKAIKSIMPPTNRKSLYRALGLFNFWRRFVKNYAQNTYNLRKLLHKDAVFIWTNECQKELDYLKTCLINDPILKPIDTNKDVIIMADASEKMGYGYMMMQLGDDGNLHAVSYGAKSVTKAQSRYTPAELELIAVVMAIKEYEYFLIQKKITILTDCARVLHLDRWNAVNARQRRWLAYLMQFNLCVKFVKGCRNYAADALSRIFEDFTVEQKLEFAPDCSSNDEFIVVVDDPSNDISRDGQRQTDDISTLHSVIDETSQTGTGESPDYMCYQFLVDADSDGHIWHLNPSATSFVPQCKPMSQQALDDTSASLFDHGLANQKTLVELGQHRPLTKLPESLDDNQSLINTTPNQMATHSEVAVVHTTNSQCNPMTATTDDNTDQTHRADSTEDGQPLVDDDTVPVQSNAETVINLADLPPITTDDYLQDAEFKNMFQYLNSGDLTGNDDQDRLTLLMADQYFIENDALYRMSTPRNRKQDRLRTHDVRLCIPLLYRHDILSHFHDTFGHMGVQRLFLTLSERLYWKNLYTDLHDYVKSCDVCLRAKRNYAFRSTPLHPLEVPNGPCEFYHLDHKNLTRPTKAGNVGILCIIDAFSGWPVLKAVPDLTALTTAKVFFREIVAVFGVPTHIMTDKGPAFMGQFFRELASLLGIKHRSSSAGAKRSNGMAERLIQTVSQTLKYYCDNDRCIDDSLPLCEMSLRSTVHSRLNISSYEILFGRKMRLAVPGEPIKKPVMPPNQLQYYEWLKEELKALHEGVRLNKLEIKEEDKAQYDKKNSVAPPQWTVGDRVLVEDRRIKPHSESVLTHRPFNLGPFFVSEIVKGKDDIGQAYRLVDCNTGKPYRRLVSADRLKSYTADRVDFTARLPRLSSQNSNKESIAQQQRGTDSNAENTTAEAKQDAVPKDCHPAIRILKERTRGKRKEFYVQFEDKTKHWCDFVTPALLERYRILQDKRRRRAKIRRKKT